MTDILKNNKQREALFFTITSKIAENCIVGYLSVKSDEAPVVNESYHKIGTVVQHESEAIAVSLLKKHMLEITESDLLANVYEQESLKLENQKTRLEIKIINQHEHNRKTEIPSLLAKIKNKKESLVRCKEKIMVLRRFRNIKPIAVPLSN
ncbi:hypothetical protein [Psychromonas sp. SP041]|uniref:hypothetical protein n=1 Tax=Psychromonas sp. SP041 TaxID=1365007 RepID=UPI0010C790FA|nr:hypothetical protein [Psychromonas sp. SP041]